MPNEPYPIPDDSKELYATGSAPWPVRRNLIEHILRLEQENAYLKAQLEALSWREIDDTHLPKVGDEVGRLPESYALKIRGNSKILVVTGSMVRVFSDDSGARLWIEQDWTHYRPHTPPQPKGTAKEATDAK